MKKKIIFLMALMMVMLPLSSVQVSAASTPIPLTGGYVDPNGEGETDRQRSPIVIPNVEVEDYTLFFITPCDGCELRLLDEDSDVAYSTIIPDGTTSLVLPTYLSGDYEIQIIRGGFYFWGYISL